MIFILFFLVFFFLSPLSVVYCPLSTVRCPLSTLQARMLLPQKEISVDDLAQRAEIVFKGVCREKKKEWVSHPDTKAKIPLDVYFFDVEEGIKGDLGKEFQIKQISDLSRREAYELKVQFVGRHRFEIGKSYLLFLGPPKQWGIRPLIGGNSGQRVVTEEGEYKEFVGKVKESLGK